MSLEGLAGPLALLQDSGGKVEASPLLLARVLLLTDRDVQLREAALDGGRGLEVPRREGTVIHVRPERE